MYWIQLLQTQYAERENTVLIECIHKRYIMVPSRWITFLPAIPQFAERSIFPYQIKNRYQISGKNCEN